MRRIPSIMNRPLPTYTFGVRRSVPPTVTAPKQISISSLIRTFTDVAPRSAKKLPDKSDADYTKMRWAFQFRNALLRNHLNPRKALWAGFQSPHAEVGATLPEIYDLMLWLVRKSGDPTLEIQTRAEFFPHELLQPIEDCHQWVFRHTRTRGKTTFADVVQMAFTQIGFQNPMALADFSQLIATLNPLQVASLRFIAYVYPPNDVFRTAIMGEQVHGRTQVTVRYRHLGDAVDDFTELASKDESNRHVAATADLLLREDISGNPHKVRWLGSPVPVHSYLRSHGVRVKTGHASTGNLAAVRIRQQMTAANEWLMKNSRRGRQSTEFKSFLEITGFELGYSAAPSTAVFLSALLEESNPEAPSVDAIIAEMQTIQRTLKRFQRPHFARRPGDFSNPTERTKCFVDLAEAEARTPAVECPAGADAAAQLQHRYLERDRHVAQKRAAYAAKLREHDFNPHKVAWVESQPRGTHSHIGEYIEKRGKKSTIDDPTFDYPPADLFMKKVADADAWLSAHPNSRRKKTIGDLLDLVSYDLGYIARLSMPNFLMTFRELNESQLRELCRVLQSYTLN